MIKAQWTKYTSSFKVSHTIMLALFLSISEYRNFHACIHGHDMIQSSPYEQKYLRFALLVVWMS